MFYQRYGNPQNATLVLLHSGGMAGVEWQPQIAPLSQHFDVWVPDLLGHGQSLIPAGETLSISLMAEAVLAMLDEQGIARAHFLGSSMGGAVALWIAIHHPQRVDKLIIYRMGYCKNPATYEQTREMADPAYWRRYGLHNWLSKLHMPQGGEQAWETVIANVSKVLNPDSSQHDHDLSDLTGIAAETLLIVGDRDPLIPLPTALAMFEALPKAALWVMPNASHITASNTWRASAFAEEVLRFLR